MEVTPTATAWTWASAVLYQWSRLRNARAQQIKLIKLSQDGATDPS